MPVGFGVGHIVIFSAHMESWILNSSSCLANESNFIFCDRILLYCDGVEMGFEPSSVPHFKGNKLGTIFLTTHRVSIHVKNTHKSFYNIVHYNMVRDTTWLKDE